ncbi:Uncharacterised protein [Corynebacterium jeikeium]|nr:Uncharacterised protein [Corynebacterium jeikeium]
MRDRIADEGHAAQYHVSADHTADQRGENRHQQRLRQEGQGGIRQVGEELGEGNHDTNPTPRNSGESGRTSKVSIHGSGFCS